MEFNENGQAISIEEKTVQPKSSYKKQRSERFVLTSVHFNAAVRNLCWKHGHIRPQVPQRLILMCCQSSSSSLSHSKNIPDAFSISVLSDCICHLKKLINHLALAVVIMAEAVCLLKIFSEKIHSENWQFGFGVLVKFRTKAVHIRSDKANGSYERIVNYQLIIVTKIRFCIDTILYM